MRLEPGMLIKTNYSGPYRIKEIERGCRCPLYIDTLDMDNPPPQPEHIHLTLTNPDGTGRFYLNHYIEETLTSLDKSYCGQKKEPDYDHIIVIPNEDPLQLTLF